MKKLLPVAALAFALMTSCNGSTPAGFGSGKIDFGVSTSDGSSGAIVTKTITAEKRDDNGNVTTPAAVAYSTSDIGSVKFVFQARPGSDAAYITGYRITRYLINGEDVLGDRTMESNKSNIYVGSGYRCAERTVDYSCPANSTTLEIANGLPSTDFMINFASALIDDAIASESTVSSSVDLEFIGKTSNNVDFTLPVKGINTTVSFKVVSN